MPSPWKRWRRQCKPGKAGEFGMYLGCRWYRLSIKPELIPHQDPVKRLDVSLLQDNLIGPILGVADPRRDKRIDFVGGIRGLAELERRVEFGRDGGGLLLSRHVDGGPDGGCGCGRGDAAEVHVVRTEARRRPRFAHDLTGWSASGKVRRGFPTKTHDKTRT